MAKVHALEAGDGGKVRCAIHYLVPAGSNSAGVTWKAAKAAEIMAVLHHAAEQIRAVVDEDHSTITVRE